MTQNPVKGSTDLSQYAFYPLPSMKWIDQEFRVCDNCHEYLGKEETCRKCKKSFNPISE